MALSRGISIQQYLDDWLIRAQSPEEALHSTKVVVDLTESLGWIINQDKSEVKITGINPQDKQPACSDCKTFNDTHWVASINQKDGHRRSPSHETLSVASQRETLKALL